MIWCSLMKMLTSQIHHVILEGKVVSTVLCGSEQMFGGFWEIQYASLKFWKVLIEWRVPLAGGSITNRLSFKIIDQIIKGGRWEFLKQPGAIICNALFVMMVEMVSGTAFRRELSERLKILHYLRKGQDSATNSFRELVQTQYLAWSLLCCKHLEF